MNAKRLHIHSLPLVGLGLAVTGAVALYAADLPRLPGVSALIRPAFRIEVRGAASARIMPNAPPPVETPGVFTDIPSDGPGLSEAASGGSSLMLQLNVDQAVRPAAPTAAD